ncbi:unnamed protein product [Protopolystoma xenopodis]|uniref:Uncharacterized protein n=1 Tax=Protopolystoma xenopodis TaxID=117903 RepID=A0A3S5A9M9_9PLAT|nr:unnamed protein product [Protopolystoma xenopodis]
MLVGQTDTLVVANMAPVGCSVLLSPTGIGQSLFSRRAGLDALKASAKTVQLLAIAADRKKQRKRWRSGQKSSGLE